jgi:MFS family permease
MQAWKEIPYTLFTIGEFLGFLGLYIPFFYVSSYALKKTSASEELAFYFVPILNAASLFGRIIPNFLADKTGPLNMLIPCSLISAILALCWIAIDDVAGLAIFGVLYGFFSGTFVSLPPSTVASLSPDLKQVGTRMGMSFSFAGLGLLIGNPIAGAIINLETGDFIKAQIFCGVVVAAAGVVMIFARIAKVGLSLTAVA